MKHTIIINVAKYNQGKFEAITDNKNLHGTLIHIMDNLTSDPAVSSTVEYNPVYFETYTQIIKENAEKI